MVKPIPFDRSKIIRCGTTQYMNKLKRADPSLGGRLDEYETHIQEHIKASSPQSDTICFKEYKGEVISQPYNGVPREWSLFSHIGGDYCYKLIQ